MTSNGQKESLSKSRHVSQKAQKRFIEWFQPFVEAYHKWGHMISKQIEEFYQPTLTLFSIKSRRPLQHKFCFCFERTTAATDENKRKIYIINLKTRRVIDANDDDVSRRVDLARPPVKRG